MNRIKKVLIIQKIVPQYRVEFFDRLRFSLLQNNIELVLVYGKSKNKNSKKKDERNLSFATFRENFIIKIGSTELIWQPCLDLIFKADLIIVEQANSLLLNYFLIGFSKFMGFKFAYWGHGANLQHNENSSKNRFKYFFINKSDYWFAYTKGVAKFLKQKGVEKSKIYVINNAIDTKTLKDQYNKISDDAIIQLKKELGITGDNVAIYCGAIYKEKRIDFLIEVAKRIKKEIIDFHLLVVGSGPDDFVIKKASNDNSWIHYIGPKFEKDKVPYFKISDLFLMPHLVGLSILDSFATETPMVTTEFANHGPEIEYLVNGENGLITKNNIDDYVLQIIDLFRDKDEINELKRGCNKSSTTYNIEMMVENFKNGIITSLS